MAEHDHDHDHDDDMPELEGQQKHTRGEKKCRKALTKIGMKEFTGVTRVTLRKRDGLIFFVNEPEVLRSDGEGKSFAVFGELKLEDQNARLQQAEAKKFAESQLAAAKATAGTTAAAAKVDDSAPMSEEGVTADHISMVMEHTQCSRNEAIAALRETNDDMIQAVMTLTKWAYSFKYSCTLKVCIESLPKLRERLNIFRVATFS